MTDSIFNAEDFNTHEIGHFVVFMPVGRRLTQGRTGMLRDIVENCEAISGQTVYSVRLMTNRTDPSKLFSVHVRFRH